MESHSEHKLPLLTSEKNRFNSASIVLNKLCALHLQVLSDHAVIVHRSLLFRLQYLHHQCLDPCTLSSQYCQWWEVAEPWGAVESAAVIQSPTTSTIPQRVITVECLSIKGTTRSCITEVVIPHESWRSSG